MQARSVRVAWARRPMRQVSWIIAGLFLVWLSFVLFATRARGPGLSPDAMSYLAGAESIARGAGPEVPFAAWSQPDDHSRLRHFPPLFPALIAVPVWLGVSAAQSARWLEACAAGVLAVLLAWIALSCVDRARAALAALVAGLCVLLAPAISLAFFMVLSEPLFLLFWALTLLVMIRAPTASWALGCCAACCALTRYAGISVMVAVVLWVVSQPGSVQQRCMRVLTAAAPTLIGLALWRRWSGGEFRRFAWYLSGLPENMREALGTVRQALVPLPDTVAVQPWHILLSVAVAGLALVPLMAAAKQRSAPRFTALWRAVLLMTGCYLGILVASRLRADPDIPFDWRILSPLILSWQLTLTIALVRQWDSSSSRVWRVSTAGLTVAWLAAASWNAAHNVSVMQRAGALYDGPAWQDTEFAGWLRSAGRRYDLYSNNPAVLWHLDHRSSRLLPEANDATTRTALRDRLTQRSSALLGFRDAFSSTADPRLLAAQLGLSSPRCFEQVCVWTVSETLVSGVLR
jgi:hypothetical protein